jgi:hypothetical protein
VANIYVVTDSHVWGKCAVSPLIQATEPSMWQDMCSVAYGDKLRTVNFPGSTNTGALTDLPNASGPQ